MYFHESPDELQIMLVALDRIEDVSSVHHRPCQLPDQALPSRPWLPAPDTSEANERYLALEPRTVHMVRRGDFRLRAIVFEICPLLLIH